MVILTENDIIFNHHLKISSILLNNVTTSAKLDFVFTQILLHKYTTKLDLYGCKLEKHHYKLLSKILRLNNFKQLDFSYFNFDNNLKYIITKIHSIYTLSFFNCKFTNVKIFNELKNANITNFTINNLPSKIIKHIETHNNITLFSISYNNDFIWLLKNIKTKKILHEYFINAHKLNYKTKCVIICFNLYDLSHDENLQNLYKQTTHNLTQQYTTLKDVST